MQQIFTLGRAVDSMLRGYQRQGWVVRTVSEMAAFISYRRKPQICSSDVLILDIMTISSRKFFVFSAPSHRSG